MVSDEDDASAAEEAPVPAKKTKAKKGTAKASNGTHVDEEAPKAKLQKRGRPKKAAMAEED